MGLAASQAILLSLTARKASCEEGLAATTLKKMAILREQTNLSQKYSKLLKAKTVAYYANGKYNKVNYNYLMGYNSHLAILTGDKPLKPENSMILTDYKGQVVMSDFYTNAILKVLGNSAIDSQGRGKNFSPSKIPEILANLVPGFTAEEFKAVIDGNETKSHYNANMQNTMTGEATGEEVIVDNSEDKKSNIEKIVDFYFPIFAAAAANGWTKEYNVDMYTHEDYVSDAITTGTFQLAQVDETGNYDPAGSLEYFVMSGLLTEETNVDDREEVTAWYNAEKARLGEKESMYSTEMTDWNTELEAIKTEMQSIQSLIDDAVNSVFDWGTKA